MHRAGVFFLLATVTLGGCIRPSITPTVRYTLEPAIEVSAASGTDRTLGVRQLRAPILYRTPMLYKEGLQVHQYAYAEWAMNPDSMVTRAIIDAIAATKRFHDVADASSVNRPELMLVGELRRFEADRDVNPPEAVCEVRLELRETFGTKLLWADTLTARVPLQEDHLPAIPQAMSEAVAQIANRAATEIAKH